MSADFATQYAFGNLKEKLADMSMLDMYKDLDVIQKLQSGSDFVDIAPKEYFEEIPADSYADSVAERFIKELDELFASKEVCVRRAVMASVLSMLPVFSIIQKKYRIILTVRLYNVAMRQKKGCC